MGQTLVVILLLLLVVVRIVNMMLAWAIGCGTFGRVVTSSSFWPLSLFRVT